jgi:hypothetical protein
MKKKKKIKYDVIAEDYRKLISRILFSLVAFFGIVFLMIGAFSIAREVNIKSSYIQTEGQVIANFEKLSKNNKKMYVPTYIYEVGDESYTVQADVAVLPRPNEGEKAMIYYNPNHPEIAEVAMFNENQLLLVVGILMLVLPLATYLLDEDSQKYDEKADLKTLFVVFFSVISYILSVLITGTFSIKSIYNFSGVLIIIPIIYLIMAGYAWYGINKYKKEDKKKKK